MTVHERVEHMASQALHKDPLLASHGLNESSSKGGGLFSAFKQHKLIMQSSSSGMQGPPQASRQDFIEEFHKIFYNKESDEQIAKNHQKTLNSTINKSMNGSGRPYINFDLGGKQALINRE